VAEIQGKVIKQSERHSVSRLLHAKNDKEKIAAWKSDLTRILHIFSVCSVTSLPTLLTFRPQTELAINAHVVFSDIRRDVTNTRDMVSDIHHTIANKGGVDYPTRPVSNRPFITG
jgi:hypothetical protein